MPRTGQPAIRHVAAVQRAVAVLDSLADGAPELGTNEIARRTGINASTVSRLLATLAEAGLVEHDADSGRYRLGLRLLHLGNAVLARLDLREIARPHLTELAQVTGESVTLSAPGEHEAVTVDFVQSAASIQSVARVGRPSVAHATAVGKVYLAFGGQLPDGELERFTDRTITDRDAAGHGNSSHRRSGLGSRHRRTRGRPERNRGTNPRQQGNARRHPRRPGPIEPVRRQRRWSVRSSRCSSMLPRSRAKPDTSRLWELEPAQRA